MWFEAISVKVGRTAGYQLFLGGATSPLCIKSQRIKWVWNSLNTTIFGIWSYRRWVTFSNYTFRPSWWPSAGFFILKQINWYNMQLQSPWCRDLQHLNIFNLTDFFCIWLIIVLYGCETWSLRVREEGKLRVFENIVLRRIFWPRRDEVTGEWRRLHNEELNDLYSSPNIARVMKSRRMRSAGHVARMGEERGRIGSWWGNRREGEHWGELGVDAWIILGWISRRCDMGMWTGLGWPRIGTGGGRLWVR